jgi:hypothetical protein
VSWLRVILPATVCLTLVSCDYMGERYLVRRDAVTPSAGDAVVSSSAVQIPTPWPRGSNNPNIVFDGEKIGGAVKAYREDKEFLREQEIDKANIPLLANGGRRGARSWRGGWAAAGARIWGWRGARAVRVVSPNGRRPPAWFEDEAHLGGIISTIAANVLPVKMTIPLGLFIFPAILIGVPTPARIRMASAIEKRAGG